MSGASQGRMSHADRHDLDKLARWKAGLEAAAGDGRAAAFPVCAIFLVSPDDRASHDVFRRYRSAFEELGGGFHHLVIFGQHGVSTTQVAFLAEVEREQSNIPLLVIAAMSKDAAGSVHCIELPKGQSDGEPDDCQPWGAALERIRAAASGQSPLSLDGMDGVGGGAFRRGTLAEAVSGVFTELDG